MKLLAPKKWPGWFAYAQDNEEGNVRGWREEPGPQGHWILRETSNGHYLISASKWPDWFMYMQDNDEGNVRLWKGDPGPQGHWLLTRKGGHCLLSTVKWPGWYMYMQDNEEGNVRGWKGDPGPQGHWLMLDTVGDPEVIKAVECKLDPVYELAKGTGFRQEETLSYKVGSNHEQYSESQVTNFASQARAKVNW